MSAGAGLWMNSADVRASHPQTQLRRNPPSALQPGWCRARASASRQRSSLRQTRKLERLSRAVCMAATETEALQVTFRKVDTFDLWIWLEMAKAPTADERELLEMVFQSWYTLGRLGGFNSLNLQVFYKGDVPTSTVRYSSEELANSGSAYFHELGDLESRGRWCRAWVNMGTADEFALDILINALDTFSREEAEINQLIIGGVNKDWPVPIRETPNMDGLPPDFDTQNL